MSAAQARPSTSGEYLAAGAESVHLATAVMVDPEVGLKIRGKLAGE